MKYIKGKWFEFAYSVGCPRQIEFTIKEKQKWTIGGPKDAYW